MRHKVAFISRVLAAATVVACATSTVRAADLTVSAAVSLANAFREIGPAFEAASQGDKVHFNHGASGALLQQIVRGAPVDVFASADAVTMDRAQAQHVVVAALR